MPELPHGAPPGPVTPIGELAHWELRIWCSRCKRRISLRVADVIERQGQRLPIYQAVAKLRCSGWAPPGRCGAPPSQVVLVEVERYGKSTRVLREIVVLPCAEVEGD